MKNKRSKLQIYFDVLSAILVEKQDNTEISKTRLQHKSNTSYDKLLKYLDEMSEKGLIKLENEIDRKQAAFVGKLTGVLLIALLGDPAAILIYVFAIKVIGTI